MLPCVHCGSKHSNTMREGRLSILFSAVLQGGLGEVKDIMIQNIERVLERGEKLDLLVDKTDNLQVISHCSYSV